MYTLSQNNNSEYTISKSQFFGYVFSIDSEEEARLHIKKLKEDFADASHVCYGLRILGKNNSLLEKSSDHGEPNGTAGKPILNVLKSEEIVNAIILVVRYYGGTNLGIPGLIKAYKYSAALTLENITKTSYVAYEHKNITITIQEYDTWKYNLEKQGGIIVNVDFGLFVDVEYKLPV